MELETLNFLTSATSLQILTLSGSEEIDDQILRNFLETQTGLYQLQLTNFPRITGEVLPTFDKFHNLYRLSFRGVPTAWEQDRIVTQSTDTGSAGTRELWIKRTTPGELG